MACQPGHGRSPRRGAAMGLVVILMLVISVTGLTTLQIGQAARVRSLDNSDDIAARYAADAGIARALYLMNQSLAAGAWGSESIPALTAEPLPGSDAVYSVTITGSIASDYTLTSVGRAGSRTRTVRVTARLSNPFALNYAVLSRSAISLNSKSTVAGFHSGSPSLKGLRGNIGTLSDKHGSIDIKNNAEVYGDVYVGPDGDPDKIIAVKDRSDVKGEFFTLPLPPPLPSVSAPSLTPRGNLSISNNDTVTLNSHQGQYGKIDIGNGGTLKIEGDSVLVVTGDIDLKNSAEVQIADGGSLTLYLAGDFDGKNSAGINNQSAVPSGFKLYGTGSKQTIDLKNSTDFYGVIFAPNADLTLHNDGSAYGSVIVNNFEMKNDGDIFYDKALNDAGLMDKAATFVIVRWEEVSTP